MGALVLAARLPLAAPDGDERILLFPAFLTWDEGQNAWRGTIRGRVFEHDARAPHLARAALRHVTRKGVKNPTDEERETFNRRAEQFVADSERGETVVVTIGGRSFVSARSRRSGHFLAEVVFGTGSADAAGSSVPFRARLEDGDGGGDGGRKNDEVLEVEGTAQLVGPTGVSVISDIDDTVKDSNVLDRRELVANTFYRPYRPVAGMPGAYAGWIGQGVAIHYVTASPWQLFPALWPFLHEQGMEGASIAMRDLRLTDATVLDFVRDSRAYKRDRVREILERFPARRFVLVGDSGEADPEIYAAAARDYPRVEAVFIRAVTDGHADRARYGEVFRGVAASRWIVFRHGDELPRDLAAWLAGRAEAQP